ncbi:response regulator [candidate division GN15 bacterium]|uniref:Response regulator n=1 Tax=candidate division GN15 bacterium TaxID=2072418 RepID=A0A855X4Y6_9BACT|nr:MAG: response regulator [candidate division GN15 bacterium]
MAKILLVDDSSFQRKLMSKMLCSMGHRVTEAENGRKGLDLVDTLEPDMIITDLLMPELDGIGLLRDLKKRDSAIPAVVVSADIQETTRQECLQLGARDFLNKPVKHADLAATVERLLQSIAGEESKC